MKKNEKEVALEKKRSDARKNDELRKVKIIANYLEVPYSSVLVEFGKTKVLCAVSIEESIPKWMLKETQEQRRGWITSEYSMLPYSSGEGRQVRESARGKIGGRTQEIQRLIGRSFRSVIDLKKLGERTIWVDCDVLQADGGTRTAAITGGFVALLIALEKLRRQKKIKGKICSEYLAAVSVGLLNGKPILDLSYKEDCTAQVDMNVVMTESGKFVEIQGTAEEHPFSDEEMQALLELAQKGIQKLIKIQKKTIEKAFKR